MSTTEFVHLHCHSEYSVENSLIRIPKLVAQAKNLGLNAIALTDKNNLFAAIKFYKAAKGSGIKPIFGAEITLQEDQQNSSLLLLCQDRQGYLNLSELISLSYQGGQGMEGASVSLEQLQQYNQGLIMIALPVHSNVAQALIGNQIPEAQEKAIAWQQMFGDRFYLGLQRTNRVHDEQHLHLCIELGLALDIPMVATNNVEFLEKDEFEAHEARICISQGGLLDDARREKNYCDDQYLKSGEEMNTLFSDLPEVIANSVEIAKRCNVHFELNKKNYLPNFPVPEGLTMAEFFSQESETGLEKRLTGLVVDRKVYDERLTFELSVINEMDFPGYFLIVADFIRWSKDNGIPVGPGRGSGAGSLVAYVLGITNVDPIKHELLFERFLNPERVSMPDFDVDFCTDRRDEVIEYVSKKYGAEKVSQIITYGTMAAKGVVRDVGRVLGHPYGFSDRISKSIPNDLKINLSRALGRFADNDSQENKDKWFSEELKQRYDSEESVTALLDLSLKLEGLVRNVGTHAGGVLIAPSKISDFCPTYKASDEDGVVSQFDMKDVEAVGLVKFDFLGLSNLTVIDKTVKLIHAKGLSEELIDIDALSLDDEAVYKLLQACDTTGIFQLESDGMRGYLKKLQADSFEDIVAMLALYRPGPLDAGMVDDYINVKHGTQKVKYPHPMLEGILAPTNGVFLYQEQVMQSAQVMAGYSLGGADLLRRAMGKKIASEMDAQRSVFVKGAAENDIDEKKANEIFDLIDKFSGYGFNKSHSVAYAYVSYQTAWLKSHYPAAFMASVLSRMMDDTDRVSFTVNEIRAMTLTIKGPSVNESLYEFSIKDDATIIYGLGAIKGVGEALVEVLVAERDAHGEYQNLFDFCMRIEKRTLNKRALEALIYSGALDKFGIDRAVLIQTYPSAMKQAEQRQNDRSSGQSGLFAEAQGCQEYDINYESAPSFSFRRTLQLEKIVMGYYFYQHPTDEHKNDMKSLSATLPKNLTFRNNKEARVLALISEVHYRTTRKGNQMASIVLEDGQVILNAVIFSKTLETEGTSEQLNIDTVVIASGTIEKDDYRDGWQLVVNKVENIDAIKEKYAKSFDILLNHQHSKLFEQLATTLKQNQGQCPVRLYYQVKQSRGSMLLNNEYSVSPNQQLVETINALLGNNTSRINY
ncbi:DNA polymerase III alpha subunit (EC [Bathymodiolus thermophilus thioautotrophic gill symbiont]|uniref:DNA polymerase III subunit alpha n=1 Tax=Bathymodiolus thermophilus thioautotrophic gill symbiont TaxID=2360 RepID=A0A1J5TT51_9GAMM|nr:DNA polymerase III subunit alpha [Bathymodiolus thermophilus thioautotrophic gill symbiont]AYQ56211.1 DNA polymerase III subunit alpha [Bathymodiolus thermophilus thioautotrophic gill symbiont]OIR24048.1 DNA polymerase III subunit alpha [Bathymodiolus thermophilus thioautotrophic gill symbiont]CAB5505835.1 DNA polymerase III alpha subunit (EC [Bathymodiolus thermophilus thioautotrophic gill symbiont]